MSQQFAYPDDDPRPEGPSIRLLRASTLTSRKRRPCDAWGCRQPITPGQRYRVAVTIEDGAFEVRRVHRSHSHPY